MASNGFFRVCQNGEGPGPLSRALREIKQVLCEQSLFLYYIKQIDSMLPSIYPVIDHRGRQNVVFALRSSDFVNHSYDYGPNWTPLSPITIIYYTLSSLSLFCLSGRKRTVNFRNQHLWRHNCRLYNNHVKVTSNHVKVTGNHVMYDHGVWFLRPRPHVSGYFRIRNFFVLDTATVHTYPANSTANP